MILAVTLNLMVAVGVDMTIPMSHTTTRTMAEAVVECDNSYTRVVSYGAVPNFFTDTSNHFDFSVRVCHREFVSTRLRQVQSTKIPQAMGPIMYRLPSCLSLFSVTDSDPPMTAALTGHRLQCDMEARCDIAHHIRPTLTAVVTEDTTEGVVDFVIWLSLRSL